MTPEEIEQMKRDREAGTPGPWWLDGEMIFAPDGPAVPWQVAEAKADCGYPDGCQTEPNARRIARVPALEAEVLRLREALAGLVSDFDNLIAASEGVYGLHLNGDLAPWNELTQGGAFEEWTAGLEPARTIIDGSPI